MGNHNVYYVKYVLDANQQKTLEMLTDWANAQHDARKDEIKETPADFFSSIMQMGALGHVNEALDFWARQQKYGEKNG